MANRTGPCYACWSLTICNRAGHAPAMGPANGKRAVGEQQLLEASIDRLPASSLVVGTPTSESFRCLLRHQRGHSVLLRLTAVRALHLAGGPLQTGWIAPSLEAYPGGSAPPPHLPKDACVHGRLLWVWFSPPTRRSRFCWRYSPPGMPLRSRSWTSMAALEHRDRLRTLKGTLHLEQLRCTTPEMVAKELDLAMAAYNSYVQ